MKDSCSTSSLKRAGSRRFFAIFLSLALMFALLPAGRAKAQSGNPLSKLSPALAQALGSNNLLVWSDPSRQTVRTLIQTYAPASTSLTAAITAAGGSIVRRFTSINAILAELPKTRVLTIAARSDVERMTGDHLAQQSASHLEAATLADAVRDYRPLTRTFNGLDGSGVGIAILDSGIMPSHNNFDNSLGLLSRVTASTDIVSGNVNLLRFEGLLGLVSNILEELLGLGNKDGYGHGSHVAGVAAGRSIGTNSSRGFEGIAPNANLIDVRVLDSRGLGQASDVIAGIDWVIANKASRNIKVMNLSLGAASSESWETDPLCRAVRRAVAAGITVVAAAGNYGQTSDLLERYGSITAPGNDPTVITVGAVNTHQTDARGDESITYFSSRGPTRGFSVDQSNVKHYDNLIKPDLVAPGNRIVAAESRNSWLPSHYPYLHTSGAGPSAFMQLSGTSIAAPAVAGAAALLYQKNPGLTPPLVKAILQYTAGQLPNANICQQGAGLLNIEGATRLAGALRTDISQGRIRAGEPMLAAGASMPAPVSNVSGQNIPWGKYIFAGGSHILAGAELFRRYQPIYNPALVWVRGDVEINGSPVTNTQLVTAGVMNADVIASSNNIFTSGLALSNAIASGQAIVFSEGIVLSEGMILCESIVFSEGIVLSEAIVFSESIVFSEGMILTEGTSTGEAIVFSESCNLGESN